MENIKPKKKKGRKNSVQVTATASQQEDQMDDEELSRIEKSQLLARLDEMKRAIDGYKEAKNKEEQDYSEANDAGKNSQLSLNIPVQPPPIERVSSLQRIAVGGVGSNRSSLIMDVSQSTLHEDDREDAQDSSPHPIMIVNMEEIDKELCCEGLVEEVKDF